MVVAYLPAKWVRYCVILYLCERNLVSYNQSDLLKLVAHFRKRNSDVSLYSLKWFFPSIFAPSLSCSIDTEPSLQQKRRHISEGGLFWGDWARDN